MSAYLDSHIMNGGYVFRNFIGRMYDGDTWNGVIDLGFKMSYGNRDFQEIVKLRVAGCDTPEIRPLRSRKAGIVARNWAQLWINSPTIVILSERWIRGKYSRVIGDFYYPSTERTLSEALIANGLAKRSSRDEAKEPWSDAELEALVQKYWDEFGGPYEAEEWLS